jgi:hypothetical protein
MEILDPENEMKKYWQSGWRSAVVRQHALSYSNFALLDRRLLFLKKVRDIIQAGINTAFI